MLDEKDEMRMKAILLKDYWTTNETEFYLQKRKGIQITASSLRTMISRGNGPAYFKWNNHSVRYNKALVDEWIDKKMSEPKLNSMNGGW